MMIALRFVLSVAVAIILVDANLADDKAPIKKELLVGAWVSAKLPEGLPPGSTITVEFTMDGMVKVMVKVGDKESPPHLPLEGAYSIDGDKLTVVGKEGDKDIKRTVTISKLTEKELITVGKESDGKTDSTAEFIKK